MRLALLASLAALLVLAPAAGAREWLAGDLHVHTCLSHDVFCPTHDDPTDPEELPGFYTMGFPVEQRFQEAAARGLDYLAITDHNDTRSVGSPGFGGHGVVGIPGYEASLDGHGQVLGSPEVLEAGRRSAAEVNAMADGLRAAGGVLQANHPAYQATESFAGCDQTDRLDWGYGYAVRPDTIELWNPTAPVRDAERWLECWLQRGERVAITAGSDSHWVSTTGVQGLGNPTTWVLADERSAAGVLGALRAGRTSLGRTPPNQGGAPLRLEVLADGGWRNAIGEDVAAGAPMRVVAPTPGLVTVRAGGADLVREQAAAPGVQVTFTAPASGWVRAKLHLAGDAAAAAPDCGHESGRSSPISFCAYDHTLLGATSPAYVRVS